MTRSVVRDGRDESDRRYAGKRMTPREADLLHELELERELFRTEVGLAVSRERQRIVDRIRASDALTTGWSRPVVLEWIIDVVEGR